MTKHNPFPGMNPFLERHWSDVHTKLITYIADALGESLPDDLTARSEEHITLVNEAGEDSTLRADVAVVESWKQGVSPKWQPEKTENSGVTLSEPQIIIVEEFTERWLNITDKHGRLITVIELLSPSNKGTSRTSYISRREAYIERQVNLVEIDLLRGGQHTVAVPANRVRRPAGACTMACVTRARDVTSREVYVMPLRQPLSSIPIPLREGEADIPLALQSIIDLCYLKGGYWKTDHTNVPGPPLNADDAAWVAEQVKAAGLAG